MYNLYSKNAANSPIGTDLAGKKSIYERLKKVYEKTPQLTTVADVDKAKADYETSNAMLTVETNKSEAEYQSLLAQLKAIDLQIFYLNIKAPFSGVITNRFIDKGAVIQNGLTNSSSMPMFELQSLIPIRLTLDVPEADATVITQNTKAAVSFPELPAAKYDAIVSRIAYGLDEATKTMKVEIDLPNKDLKIRNGMYAKVFLQRGRHKNVLSVPNEAIGNVQRQSFLYVVNEGKVKKINIQTGIQDNHFTEILNAELKETDQVIIQGKELSSDGAMVNVKNK
ncbi:efflux RND transporter periplasmic adaptor subunit [Ferruginibacter sp.]|uniref:efflux RND transporter periplasmic adaptor subunit n=1 Tax=Ferruginibacter sp. TaxID=1940288 RepID=UPI00374CE645